MVEILLIAQLMAYQKCEIGSKGYEEESRYGTYYVLPPCLERTYSDIKRNSYNVYNKNKLRNRKGILIWGVNI